MPSWQVYRCSLEGICLPSQWREEDRKYHSIPTFFMEATLATVVHLSQIKETVLVPEFIEFLVRV